MPPEKNPILDVLNGESEKEELFKEEETDVKDDVKDSAETLPFHKDPKVQKYLDKEIQKALKEHQPTMEQKFRQEVKDEIDLPPALVKLVGNDTEEKREALKALASHLDSLTDKAKEKFLEEMRSQEKAVQEADNAALEELNAGFESIEEEFGVDLSKDSQKRTAFVEYLRKVSHKNADGEVDQFADIPAAWETFSEQQPAKPASRAKELASRGMTRSGDTTRAPSQGRSWKDVDRYFDSLKENN